jgi:hypothetical protein
MVAPRILGHARCYGSKYVCYVQAYMHGETKSSYTSHDSFGVQDCILQSFISWLAKAEGIEQRGVDRPPKHSYTIALEIEASMYFMWNSFATHLLLSVWFQVYVLERRVLSTPSCRVVTATDGQTHPFVTSDKTLVCQIRVNAMLTSDRIKPELLCPRWLPRRCHVGWLDVSFHYIARVAERTALWRA